MQQARSTGCKLKLDNFR